MRWRWIKHEAEKAYVISRQLHRLQNVVDALLNAREIDGTPGIHGVQPESILPLWTCVHGGNYMSQEDDMSLSMIYSRIT